MILLSPNPIEVTVLTTQMKVAVPDVEGLTPVPGGVEVRRLSGTFTPAEIATLTAVLAAHDATTILSAKAAREATRKAFLAMNPGAISIPQRLERIERILGIEIPIP